MTIKILNNIAIFLLTYIGTLLFCMFGVWCGVPQIVLIFGGLISSLTLSSFLTKMIYKEDSKQQ